MTLTITYDGAPLGFDVPPTKVAMPSRAELGNVSTGGFSPEDPAAALEMVGWRPFVVEESACTAQPRLFTGYVTDRHVGRSFEQTQFVGPEPRIHDTTVLDLNAVFNMRIITWTDGKRGEESVDDRLAWLLGSNYLAGPDGTLVEDTGKIKTGFSLLMDASDYRGYYPADVLADMSTRYATIINYFAFWDPAPTLPWPSTTPDGVPRPGLFWDYVGVATMDCSISISNAGDDNGTTIFEPDHDARLERTPEAVYSDVIVKYANGSCYRILDATATAFIKRGTAISRPHIGKLSTAQAAGDAWLAQHNIETDRITATIHVPRTVVGLIQAGMRMEAKFTHLTDYTAFTWMRIVACNPRPVDDLAQFYDVELELVALKSGPCPSPTPDGYYPPIGVPGGSGCGGSASAESDATGNVVYFETGQDPPSVPTPNYCGIWRWPQWHLTSGSNSTTPAGFADGASTNVGNFVRCLVSGPGRMTIYTRAETLSGGGTVWIDANLEHLDGIVTVTDESQTNLVPGDDIVFDIPFDGFCDHWVSLSFNGDNAIFGIGFGGFDWAAAATTGGSIAPKPGVPIVASTDPTVDDDADAGYIVGAHWINQTTGEEFVLVDSTPGAAIWTSTTAVGTGGSGGVTTPTVVQSHRGVNSPFTLGAAPIVGHRLVAAVFVLGGTATAISSANTTWTQIGTDQTQGGNATSIWVGVCAASPGATITVTHTGTSLVNVVEVADALTPTLGASVVSKHAGATQNNVSGSINVTAGHFLAASIATDAALYGVAAMLSCPFTSVPDAQAVQYSTIAIGYAPSGDVLAMGINTAGSSSVVYLVEIT